MPVIIPPGKIGLVKMSSRISKHASWCDKGLKSSLLFFKLYFYCWHYYRCPHPPVPTSTQPPPFPLAATPLLSVTTCQACNFYFDLLTFKADIKNCFSHRVYLVKWYPFWRQAWLFILNIFLYVSYHIVQNRKILQTITSPFQLWP